LTVPAPPDFLFPTEAAMIAADVVALAADPQGPGADITYRRFLSRTFTPSTGSYSPTYADLATRAVRNVVSAQQIAAAQGLYREGDIRFLIPRANLAAEPNKEDVIVQGAASYSLVQWDSDPVSAFWRIVARLVA
jgi:hypothetical protein